MSKKTVIGIGIAFVDIVIDTDYIIKNHSYLSNIQYEVGGSILNIIANVNNSGFMYFQGKDEFKYLISNFLKNNHIQEYPIATNKNTPIFTIINQKERYTSLCNEFEMDSNKIVDYHVCNDYEYGITNAISSSFINKLCDNTTTKWIVNSYIPENTHFHKLTGCIMNREESQKYHENPKDVLLFLKQQGISWAIITLDKDGVMYLENNEIYSIAPKHKNLTSKIRTGDLFTGTIIQCLVDKQSLSHAIQLAMDKVEQFLLK